MLKLTDPIKVGSLELKNRSVMAPMKSRLATEEGFITPRMIDYYVERAKGGVGLIIVEVSYVHGETKAPADVGISDDKFVPGLKQLTTAVKNNGAKIAIQLYHPGARAHSWINGIPAVAPSPIGVSPTGQPPLELTEGEINKITTSFADATARAIEAGFDAVEFHGAHGYLLTQFFSPLTNKRQDRYGGSLENRMRFALEVVSTAREKVGSNFPLFYRFAAWERMKGGITLDDSKVFARQLELASIDCLDVSTGGGGSYSIAPMSLPRGTHVPLAHAIKETVKVPVIGVCRINNPFLAEAIIREGKADLVSQGRPLTADPHFMRKYLEGRPQDIRTCLACNVCLDKRLRPETATYRYKHQCIYNPELGNERAFAISSAPVRKRILVVGAGPAGMEAARVTALRGHQVILCEKDEKLGGQIKLAAVPPFRGEMAEMIAYYTNQLSKLKVEVWPSTEVTPALVNELKPDVIIVANGSRFLIPRLKGISHSIVCTAADILSGRLRPKRRVAVIGKGQYALETAEYLAWHNCQVTILANSKELANDIDGSTQMHLLERIARDYNELNIIYNAKLEEVRKHGVIYSQRGEIIELDRLDMVVLAIALVANRELYDKLQPVASELGAEMYAVGDCQKPHRMVHAVHEAFHLARRL